VPEYHEDSVCAACDGPLEDYRDAICEACAPQSQYFEQAAAAQECQDLARAAEIRGAVQQMARWRRRIRFQRQR
jgi:hypothetical protein